MTRALLVSFVFSTFVVVACSSAVLPVAEDGCPGSAPSCFGSDPTKCCGQDPSGPATCKAGAWKCGEAPAPGCNGSSCTPPLPDGGPDDASAGCTGVAPNCFGNDITKCCGQDPAGPATCAAGKWVCGSAAAPGCNGTSCRLQNDGGATGCSPPCGANEVCRGEQTIGGGNPFPDDAGNCPMGYVRVGIGCALPPTYSCTTYPAACGATLDCNCASSVCTGNFSCVSTSAGQVNCQFGTP